MRTGLVSVSFRQLSPKEIIALCGRCALKEIEWGGDIHVPLGDTARAEEVRRLTEDAGILTNGYGSYVRMTKAERERFPALIDTARALRAPMIRVWAGNGEDCDRDEIAESTQLLCDMAKDIKIAFEYHGGTLTHNTESARELLRRIDRENALTQWQPPVSLPMAECVRSIQTLLPRIRNAHVFSWNGTTRLPLSAHETEWKTYLSLLKGDRAFMLEFVENDDPENLVRDAKTLQQWGNEI